MSRALRRRVVRKTQCCGELETWRAALKPDWNYVTVDAGNASVSTSFKGKLHVYKNPENMQAWNNWRTLRILLYQIILQNETSCGLIDSVHASTAIFVIRKMSTEVCISASIQIGSPCKQIHGTKHSYWLIYLYRFCYSHLAALRRGPRIHKSLQRANLGRGATKPHQFSLGHSISCFVSRHYLTEPERGVSNLYQPEKSKDG